MTIKTFGIDLAKNIFQIHGVDERGNAVLRKRIKRQQLMTFFANMAPCLIGMEACAGAHGVVGLRNPTCLLTIAS